MTDWIREPNEYERRAETEAPRRPAYIAPPPRRAAAPAPVRPSPRAAARSRKRRRFRRAMGWMLVLAVLVGAGAALLRGEPRARVTVAAYALVHGYDQSEYPEELVALLARNPETRRFVLDYPAEHGRTHGISLPSGGESVPLYLQWDERWGYESYAGGMMALTGCGPCCLAMAASWLTGDMGFDPLWVARWSEAQGYAVPGEGTAWALFGEGAEKLGLDAVEIGADETRAADNLAAGNLIVCVMGPGDFTTEGHFILLTAYEDGYVSVRDPNSRENSEKRWEFSAISGQMRALWVLRRGS